MMARKARQSQGLPERRRVELVWPLGMSQEIYPTPWHLALSARGDSFELLRVW